MLHEFVTSNREEIIRRCREKVAKRSIPEPSEAELDHGVPLFLDQLVEALRSGNPSAAQIDKSASQHGHDLLLQGFTVSQVVHDYGDVCQTITELAVEKSAPISTEDFKTLNRCLDEAIAGAVTRYSRESELRASTTHNEATGRTNERVGFLVHELRNLVHTAIVAFEVIKTGNVGTGGSTGGILDRSLGSLRDLIAHSLDEVRMTKGATKRERVVVADFIEQVSQAARLAADARGITFKVAPVQAGTAVEADQQILSAVVGNLLQNAFKFTRANGTVTLRVNSSADRVLIEVEDECGGLPGAEAGKDLPASFEQRGADRSGLGVGLAFSRWGAEVNGGRLYARNLPKKGCIFTVDLPRVLVPAAVLA
jgi:signal transduction histidine kinase